MQKNENDILVLLGHYQTFGAEEGREPDVPFVSGAHTERVELSNTGEWMISEYDGSGIQVTSTIHNADGSVRK